MRIAVYGGSFNPPHKSHADVASWIVRSGAADRVWLVPVFEHAFEAIHEKKLAPFSMRMKWCSDLADSLGAGVEVSDVESKLPAPSYTVDTLQYLARKFSKDTFHLVIGADILEQTKSWKLWGEIMKDFAPIIVGREGYANPELLYPGSPIFPAVSSTEVRGRLRRGDPIDELVPDVIAKSLQEGHPWKD